MPRVWSPLLLARHSETRFTVNSSVRWIFEALDVLPGWLDVCVAAKKKETRIAGGGNESGSVRIGFLRSE